MKKTLLILAALCMTLAASAAILNVASGNDLNYQIANAAEGDIICITTGDTIEWKYDQEIPVALTMMAADGIKPIVKRGGRYIVTHALTVKDITFVGKGTNEFFRVTSGTGFDLTFDGCTFKNFHYGIRIYNDAAIQVNKLTINNCIFDTYDESAIYAPKGSVAPGVIRNTELTNTTVMNGGTNSAIFICDNDENASTEGPAVLIDHCTFYKNAKDNYTLYLPKIGAQATMSNCIVSNPEDTQAKYAYYGYDGNLVNNCIWYNCTSGARSGSEKTNLTNADPQFVNAAAGDFTLRKTSPAIGAGTDASNLGDPRWGVQGDDASFVMVNPASNVNATDSYTISWTANDPTTTATITLQYSTNDVDWTNIATGIATSVSEYTWNFRGTLAAGTYSVRGTMTTTGEPITNVAPGKVVIVPDTEAPRAVRYLAADAEGTTLTLTWENPDVSIPFTETFTSTPTTHLTGASTATVTEETGAWKVDFTSTTWERAGICFACAGLNNMTGELTFEYKGNCGYQMLVLVEENNYDWWYKSVTLSAEDYTSKTISSWTNLEWHNNNPTAAFDGNNVTGVYFIINDGAATSEGTFYIKNVVFNGTVPAVADYTKTIVRVSTVDYPENVTDGDAVYEGTAATCNYTIADAPHYYFSVFTQDDLGNTSEAAHLDWPTSKWATAVDNVNAEAQAVKVIRNGQVLIIRNNKVYTTLGAEVK